MDGCIFCKIAKGEIKVNLIAETDEYVAFNDIQPQAPTHFLILPKKHVASLKDIDDADLLGKLMIGVKEVCKKLSLDEFRVVINTGETVGQSVFHLHLHVLGGRNLGWPPG